MIATIIQGVLFSALLVYAAVTDIQRREIDNWVCVAILIVSLIGHGSFWGAVVTALPFYLPAVFKGGSVGGGDIKLMFACGAVLGVWGGLTQAVIGLALAALYALTQKCCKTAKIPLAPFLGAGGIVSYILTIVGGSLV